MYLFKEKTSTEKMFYLIAAVIATGIILRYTLGINGNDFWWHIKIGEWILQNHRVPSVGIFSWYAMSQNLEWVSHEWLSEVVLYWVHSLFGNLGIFLLSLLGSLGLITLVLGLNKEKILRNILLSSLFLLFSTIILPLFFYGRPQIFSIYLLFFTMVCLYRHAQSQSKLIYCLPFISILWSNLHGGSSNMPYILCLLLAFAGLFKFSYAHLESQKHSINQTRMLIVIAMLSFLGTVINPHGIKMLLYPYVNMGDSLMLSFILEWSSPDAKNLGDLILCFIPILFVSLILLLTNKKIKLFDLIIFLFFAYLTFRSVRFILLFYIASSFIVFEYMPEGKVQSQLSKAAKIMISFLYIFLIVINVSSGLKINELKANDELILVSLESKFVSLLKQESPKRLFNDYDYSDILIYNDIPTFVDARADIFIKANLIDAYYLMYLKPPSAMTFKPSAELLKNSILDIEVIVSKYKFDAFLVKSGRSLAAYLLSHPEKYKLVLSDENASYFAVIPE